MDGTGRRKKRQKRPHQEIRRHRPKQLRTEAAQMRYWRGFSIFQSAAAAAEAGCCSQSQQQSKGATLQDRPPTTPAPKSWPTDRVAIIFLAGATPHSLHTHQPGALGLLSVTTTLLRSREATRLFSEWQRGAVGQCGVWVCAARFAGHWIGKCKKTFWNANYCFIHHMYYIFIDKKPKISQVWK